jgi:N,N'-diacetyllegionaminate synthase
MKSCKYDILLYHGVCDDEDVSPGLNSSGKHIPRSRFEHEMGALSGSYNIVTMRQIADAHAGRGSLPPKSVAVTFDDGYENNFSVAYPILKRYGVAATIYLATGFIGTKRLIWTDLLELAFMRTDRASLIIERSDRRFDFSLSSLNKKIEAFQILKAYCKRLPNHEKDKVVETAIERLIGSPPSDAPKSTRFMDWAQVREMATSGIVEFGAHTIDHVSLLKVPKDEMRRQIDVSIADVARETGRTCSLFSYPEGQPHDYDTTVIDYLKSIGIDHCPNAIDGSNDVATTDPFHIRRSMVGFGGKVFPLPLEADDSITLARRKAPRPFKLFGKDLSMDLVVIAEVGVNHEGDVAAAIRLLELAAESGADAVKFQSYTPERFVAADNAERLARVRRFGLDQDAHVRLAARAKALGVHFFSSAITEDWVPFLAEKTSAIKIASGDISFEPVIRRSARTGRPVILSTGAATLSEVARAVGWVEEECAAEGYPVQLALLHCVAAYPAKLDEANLLSIPLMRDYFGLPVGWSNHVRESEACLAAVALGASIIEVHFTDSREGKIFHDHHLSFEPQELKNLVLSMNRIRSSLGQPKKEPSAGEIPNIPLLRKGVVAARDLPAGRALTRDDLMFARPATEFPSSSLSELLGKRLVEAVGAGALIKRSNVSDG